MGTVAYMSPEQARGKPIDARTDVWAFGCVLFEMVSGKAAFRGNSPTDIIVKIAMEEPDWNEIPRLPEGISAELERVIRKCTQKDPNLRYAAVGEIISDLETLGQGNTPRRSTETALHARRDEDFALPGRLSLWLFLIIQIGYMALYGTALYHIEAISVILTNDFGVDGTMGLVGTLLLAMVGIATRVYLISAVGWRHPAAGQKFILLFPVLLILDGIWSASPLLIWRPLRYGLAFACVALLAYVPFAERTLIRSIYPERDVRKRVEN